MRVSLRSRPSRNYRNITSTLPHCPQCNSEYAYEDGSLFVFHECSHEWVHDAAQEASSDERIVKDANGNILQEGDTVTLIKELKAKGSSMVLKVGTKVKNIRIVDGDHDIDCKVEGIGPMKLKSQFVKKAQNLPFINEFGTSSLTVL